MKNILPDGGLCQVWLKIGQMFREKNDKNVVLKKEARG